MSLRRPHRTGIGPAPRWALLSVLLLVLSLAASFGPPLSGAGASYVPAGSGTANGSTAVGQTAKPVGVLSTIAGTSQGAGSSSMAQQPVGLWSGSTGLVIADEGGNFARFLARGSATESVIAGDGVPSVAGYNSDNRLATRALLTEPSAVAVDHQSDTIVADTFANRIRLVAGAACSSGCPFGLSSMTEGFIYTIVDTTGIAAYGGDNGPAKTAEINTPSGLAIDPRGDLLIADTNNDVIRLVAAASCPSSCPYGLSSMIAGDIYTIAGQEQNYGLAVNGVEATQTDLASPTGIAVDPSSGDVIVADAGSNTASLISYAGCSGTCDFGLASETVGDIYTLAGTGTSGYTGDAAPVAGTAAELDGDAGVAVDRAGNVLIADTLNNVIRLVAPANCSSSCGYGLTSLVAGDIYTIAGSGPDAGGYEGDGNPASDAELDSPAGLAVDSAGNVLIADTGNNRVRMIAATTCSSSCAYGLAPTTALDIYTVAGNGQTSGSGDEAPAQLAELASPGGVAVETHVGEVIADTGNDRLRLVAAASCSSGCPFGLRGPMVAGDIYTIAGNGTLGGSGDGGPAVDAELAGPGGIGIGASGDIVFADTGNNQVRLVAAVNCPSSCPYGLPSTTVGDIYNVAGNGTPGYSGNGGRAVSAELSAPADVAAGPFGDLLVADTSNDVIRLVADSNCAASCPYGLPSTTAGDIYTVAGSGALGSSGEGSPARSAELALPSGVAIGPCSDLVISDSMNNLIRLVVNSKCTATAPYGLASTTVGDIYTVAGNGAYGYSGNADPATKASLETPLGVTVDAAGDIFVADSNNDDVQVIWNTNCDSSCLYGVTFAPVGSISSVIGTATLTAAGTYAGTYAGSPDGEPAIDMPSADPVAVAAYPGGGVLIAEAGQDAVRLLTSVPDVVPPPQQGFWLATANGSVFPAGVAPGLGGCHVSSSDPVTGIASTPTGAGYWLVTAGGGVCSFGDAHYHGSLPGLNVDVSDIVAIAPTGDGGGYWMIGRDGGEFAFGDAQYHGSLPGLHIHVDNIVGMVATSDGGGYWIVGSDGGVFAFGDTHFVGSLPGLHVHVNDIRAMIPSPTREGYVLVGADGGAFVFGSGVHYYGSLPGKHIKVSDIVGLALTPDTLGYWFAGAKAGIYNFGDAKNLTVSSAVKANLPVVAIAAS